MNLKELIANKNISKYRLSKQSEIPYATLSDICSGKTELSKCTAETVYRLSKVLQVSMEELVESSLDRRPSFDLFKSNICHRVKELGDLEFLIEVLEKDDIQRFYEKKWYAECLYLLAMTDYLSRMNGVPLCEKYDQIRSAKLKSVLYPSSVRGQFALTKNRKVLEKAESEAIPEFMRFNIAEGDVRNVN